MNILNETTYSSIIDFVRDFRGLAIECEVELIKRYPKISKDTLKSLYDFKSENLKLCAFHSRHSINGRNN